MEKANLQKAYEGSYYTICGCGGDLKEWTDGYSNLMHEAGIGRPSRFFITKGKDVNDTFGIWADPFPPELKILMFPLDGLNVGKLAMFKLQMGDRWFDDIIDNAKAREEYDA